MATSMGCSLNLSNKFSFLNSICTECDLITCMCDRDSQMADTEDTYPIGHDDNQVINTVSETIFTVITEQQDSSYNNVFESMRPSNENIDVSLPISGSLSDDTCVNHTLIMGSDSLRSIFTPTEPEKSDSFLSTDSDQISSVPSTQVSENTISRSANVLPDDTALNQSNSNYLLDLGLKCKGFRLGHINIQGVSNKIDQVRL